MSNPSTFPNIAPSLWFLLDKFVETKFDKNDRDQDRFKIYFYQFVDDLYQIGVNVSSSQVFSSMILTAYQFFMRDRSDA